LYAGAAGACELVDTSEVMVGEHHGLKRKTPARTILDPPAATALTRLF
jgi:hypothetical protein